MTRHAPFASAVLLFLGLSGTLHADERPDLVDVAIDSERFDILCLALEAADLTETLRGEGPLTVFAPTDEAFRKLPAGTLSRLLADRSALARILSYHVVAGRWEAERVARQKRLTTLQGQPAFVHSTEGGVDLNGARILAADIPASNGVLHAIDTVLLPLDLVDTAIQAGGFDTLATALQAAELVDALRGEGPLTVFAPTDAAFASLLEGLLQSLLADPARLGRFLKFHVVSGRVLAADVAGLASAETLLGRELRIDTADGVRIGDARVVMTDILATNGVIHVIDRVLVPEAEAEDADWDAPHEADLPDGFPAMTPPGEIRIKEYDAVRGAFVAYDGYFGLGTWATFWTLFRHIDDRDIPMTAPVVASYPASVSRRRSGRMDVGFLYPDASTGEIGKAGRVEVRDLAPATYVSIGVRGDYDMTTLRRNLARLEEWLEDHSDEWRAVGDPRRLMYQQPKWRHRDRLYSEIEIPVARVAPDSSER